MKSVLRQKGIDPDRLTVVNIVGDILIGEILGSWNEDKLDLKNPRRIVRTQQMIQGRGLVVNFSMIDWDLVEEGVVTVVPTLICRLGGCDPFTQERYFSLYLGFLEEKKRMQAARAGIVLPDAPDEMPPFGGVRGRS